MIVFEHPISGFDSSIKHYIEKVGLEAMVSYAQMHIISHDNNTISKVIVKNDTLNNTIRIFALVIKHFNKQAHSRSQYKIRVEICYKGKEWMKSLEDNSTR